DCETALHETNDPKNIEESVDPGFDLGYKRTHLPSGRVYYGKFDPSHHWMYQEPNRYPPSTMETISHNAVSAWNGQQPDTWKYEIQPEISKHLSLNENLETAQEVESSIEPIKQEPLKYDVSYQTPEGEMKVDTVEGQNPHELMLHYKNLEATSGIKLVDIVHNGESVMGKIPLPAPDEMHLQHDKLEKPLVQESHMTPELKDKQEHYVMKLKKNEDSFKDKYGDRWEEVMYATATKLAKNDLGIKEETVQESEVDPLEKNCNGDSIVADQPIKN
ncbi:MAG TPA: hypothetical protein VFM18_03845, partial [Methanosarcina sp.]|nr:hypothetical protein [Methanosarcina sp.]